MALEMEWGFTKGDFGNNHHGKTARLDGGGGAGRLSHIERKEEHEEEKLIP